MSSTPKKPENAAFLDRLIAREPQIAAIGDHTVDADSSEDDALLADIVPLFDMLRHPRTRAPLRVALLGQRGSGKSSALQWLRRSLNTWNRTGPANPADLRIAAMEFNASAFATPDEARRGMLAEIILATTGVATAGVDAIRRAIHDFGPYFGRSFVLALAAQKLDSGAPIGAKEKAELAALESALDEYPARSATESLSLSAFQSRFSNSLNRALGANTRLVVLVDDLDRARDDVRHAVLDTVRLQLRLPNVFAVIALEHDGCHVGNAEQNGRTLDPSLFHVRCAIAPDEAALLRFSERELAATWPEPNWAALSTDAKALFARLAHEFAERTPLGIKRFWNRALLASAGGSAAQSTVFSENLSAFLLKELLGKRYRFATLADQHFGVQYLESLAQISIKHPDERVQLDIRPARVEQRTQNVLTADANPLWDIMITSGNQKIWREIVETLAKHPRAEDLVGIARDIDVLDLLRLGSMKSLSGKTRAQPIGRMRDLETAIINEAIQRSTRSSVGESQSLDNAAITALDLAGLEIASLESLRRFSALARLNASQTLVADLSPLAHLTALEILDVSHTGVTDVAPLRDLPKLEQLQLADTRVTNVAPLSELNALRELDLSRTHVHDVSPLAGLAALMKLSLASTRISEISGLTLLPEILSLDLRRTAIEDTIPLANLKTLTHLDLSETGVEFVAPIARLHELRSLILSGTRVADLSRIATLKNLIRLDIGDTHVSDITPLAEMASLEALELANLPLQNADPLGSLIDLRILSIAGTQISDLAPIGKLRQVVTLDMRNIPAKKLEPLKGCLSLKTLIMQHDQIDAPTRAALISRNPRLRIVEE